jgi:outer membrane cobalamin receptor
VKTPLKVTLAGALAGLLASLPAAAQTTQAAPTFSVSVTEASELVEEVGTTRRIGRTEIEARNARTLDEALRLLPGINVRTAADGTPRIDVRGFRSRHVLLLIDGVPANSTSDGQFDPARFPTDVIREIKVSYGSSSVLYGDNAMAAVIEITTLDSAPDANANVSVGTPDQHGAGGRFARTVGKWSLTGAASTFDTAGFPLPGSFTPTPLEDGGRRENSDRDRTDVRGAVGYRFSPALSLSSEWSFGTGSYGVAGSVINDPSDIFAQAPRFERVEEYRLGTGQLSVVASPTRRFNLRAWAFRNQQTEDRNRYDDDTYSSMDDPLVQGTFTSHEKTVVTGGSGLARIDLQKAGWLRLAVNQRRESFDSNGVIRDVPVGGSGSGGGGGGGGGGRGGGSGSRPPSYDTRASSVDRHVDVSSAGAEWQVHPASRVGVVLGTAVNVQQRPGGDSATEPTWITGVSYDATDALKLRASAARKVRMPSIDQLYDTAAGDPALRAERSYGVDAGADYRLGMVSSVGVSLFSTSARDFIERDTGEPFENHDRYRFRGVELLAETSRIRTVTLRAGYSFLDADDLTAGNVPLQTRPRNRGSLEWIWTPSASSAVRGAVYAAGSQWLDSRGANTVQRKGDGFTTVDLGFTQTLARRYDLAFDVTNLFDELYEQAYALPREGRAAIVTLRVKVN